MFRGGLHGVSKMCKHTKEYIYVNTTDFRPTLTTNPTSADLQQQHLTSFYAVCGALFASLFFSDNGSNVQNFCCCWHFLIHLCYKNIYIWGREHVALVHSTFHKSYKHEMNEHTGKWKVLVHTYPQTTQTQDYTHVWILGHFCWEH